MAGFPKLKILKLRKNQIKEIRGKLAMNGSLLKVVDLSENQIQATAPSDLEEYLQEIQCLSNLQEFHLQGNPICKQAPEFWVNALSIF